MVGNGKEYSHTVNAYGYQKLHVLFSQTKITTVLPPDTEIPTDFPFMLAYSLTFEMTSWKLLPLIKNLWDPRRKGGVDHLQQS